MSSAEMKAVIRSFFEEFWNQGSADSLYKYFAKNHLNSSAPPDQSQNHEGIIQFMQACHNNFKDFQLVIVDQIAEGDKVVTYWKASGTHVRGEWLGIPASGKFLHNTGMEIDRIANGKIVESWFINDQYTALEQLGGLPTQRQPG